MCDPVSMLIGAAGATVATSVLSPKPKAGYSSADAAAERAKAEAEAAASANRKLAMDQRRRREQQSLVSRGAPSLGDENAASESPLSSSGSMRNMMFRSDRFMPDVSLMGRGANQGTPGVAPSTPGRRKTIQPVSPGY